MPSFFSRFGRRKNARQVPNIDANQQPEPQRSERRWRWPRRAGSPSRGRGKAPELNVAPVEPADPRRESHPGQEVLLTPDHADNNQDDTIEPVVDNNQGQPPSAGPSNHQPQINPRVPAIPLPGEQADPMILRFPDVGPRGCRFCGVHYANPHPGEYQEGSNRETEAFLPCGHSFGHTCLYNYAQSLQRSCWNIGRCPMPDCIPIRHECHHISVPTVSPRPVLFRRVDAVALDTVCEFCDSPEGRGLRTPLERSEQKAKHYRTMLDEHPNYPLPVRFI